MVIMLGRHKTTAMADMALLKYGMEVALFNFSEGINCNNKLECLMICCIFIT